MIDLNKTYCELNLETMSRMPDNCVDAIVTDPPYGLKFMGKKWDYSVPSVEVWKECFRVLKPGGYLLSFAGTRTQHRMAVNIEDAGFEIRDMIAWVYGQGFPKSLDIGKSIDKKMGVDPISPESKQWDGWGTALKPAFEPITVARKPLSEKTVAANVLKWATGGINIDACRVGEDKISTHSRGKNTAFPKRVTEKTVEESGRKTRQDLNLPKERVGRFPTNFIHDGHQLVLDLFPETKSGTGAVIKKASKHRDGNTSAAYGAESREEGREMISYGDRGSAARFFYCAKTSRKDRNDGLGDTKNIHPTVKPTSLMQYLCRLVTPPNGIVYDPFTGSGSTGKAAILEGFNFIGSEEEEESCETANARITHEINKLK